jgi:hypothetical protein
MQWTPNEPGTYRVALRVRYRAQDGVPPGPVTEIFSPWFEITDRRVIRRADRPSDKAGTAIVVKPKPDLNLGPKPTPPTR